MKPQQNEMPAVVKAVMLAAEQQSRIWEGTEFATGSADNEPQPTGGGYRLDALNREFAFVLVGGSAVIVRETPDAPFHDRVRLLKIESFLALLCNRFVQRPDHDGKIKTITHGKAWLMEPRRRTYDGIVFHPDPDEGAAPAGYLNLWRGFAVKPKPGASYAIFRDHLLNNVADGDERLFQWIFGWFAQMLQNPREKPGTSIVLRGPMGCGKTKVGEVLGSLIAGHYFLVDDPRYLIGNFNQHMAACLFLQADEAMWGGDKAAEGRLKGLVTAEHQMVEAKGVDPVRMPNYVRIMMTSNEDWVVPAGKDERRFAVFDVNARCARNHDYFAEMDEELNSGGREALLYDLLTFDLSQVNLRSIPRTGALLEQKIRSLDPIETWLLDRLRAGAPTRKHDRWPEFVPSEALTDDYIEASERIGIKRKAAQTTFGMKIGKLLPSIRRVRRTIAGDDVATATRVWGYEMPDLERAREQFSELLGQAIDWGADHDD